MKEYKFNPSREFKLQNVSEPNLVENIFDFEKIPIIEYDDTVVKPNLPEEFWITCTTFRDGQQARPPYTVEQIVDLYKLLNKLGGKKGLIRQSEFFLYSDKDKEAVRKCIECGYEFPEVTGWIRAVKSDFKLVKEMKLKETGILTSCSDYHIFLKLKKSRQEALDGYIDVVKEALDNGIIPRCHLEDVTRADFEGFVIPFVQELMKLAEQYKSIVRIRLCDTMGFGLPDPYTTMPRSVPKILYSMIHDGGVPSEWLEWHGHNDFHKVLINGTAAWMYGCSAVNGTLLGYGERTGNPPIEGLVIDYLGLRPEDLKDVDTTVINEIADYYRGTVKASIPSNFPFVGTDFNVTRAGIHADGVMKSEKIYNIFNTTKLLNRPIGVAITDKSGLAGTAHWLNTYLGLSGNERISKHDDRVKKIQDWINEQYTNGRITAISNLEMTEQAKKYFK